MGSFPSGGCPNGYSSYSGVVLVSEWSVWELFGSKSLLSRGCPDTTPAIANQQYDNSHRIINSLPN